MPPGRSTRSSTQAPLPDQPVLHHLHLWALTHLVLTHHAIEGVGAQARKANIEVTLPPMSQRLRNSSLS